METPQKEEDSLSLKAVTFFQLRYFTAITTQIFLPLCIGPRKRLKYSAHHHLLSKPSHKLEERLQPTRQT